MKRFIVLLVIMVLSFPQINAQCFPDRHSTNWYDGWISCEVSPNPNSTYGNSHWILYDFGEIYSLSTMKLWNFNEPNHLDYGISSLIIEYSIDGINWIILETFELDQATGSLTYEGQIGPDFENILAQYVLLTPTSNYGGNCFALGEIKIDIGDGLSVVNQEEGFKAFAYPNPFTDYLTVNILTFYPNIPVVYSISDMLGRKLSSGVVHIAKSNTIQLSNDQLHLSTGIYLLSLNQGKNKQMIKIIKE